MRASSTIEQPQTRLRAHMSLPSRAQADATASICVQGAAAVTAMQVCLSCCCATAAAASRQQRV